MSFSNLTSTNSSSSRPKDKSLQTQLTTLTSELELSTFLNKGILQSNSEYKIRIAELERENTILRAAEARLAETEEMLESVEKQYKVLKGVLDIMRREKEGVVQERDGWKARWENVKGRWEMVKRGMEEVCKDEEVVQNQSSRRKPVSKGVQPGRSSSRQRLQTPSPPLPEYTPALKGIAVKRKRVPVSSSEESPEPIIQTKAKSSTKDGIPASRGKTIAAQRLATKPARPSRGMERIAAVAVTPLRKVKVEPVSPGDEEESDDDPLAIS